MARELWNLTEIGRYLNVSTEAGTTDRQRGSDLPRATHRAAPTMEPRQGRTMGGAALVGNSAVEEAATLGGVTLPGAYLRFLDRCLGHRIRTSPLDEGLGVSHVDRSNR